MKKTPFPFTTSLNPDKTPNDSKCPNKTDILIIKKNQNISNICVRSGMKDFFLIE